MRRSDQGDHEPTLSIRAATAQDCAALAEAHPQYGGGRQDYRSYYADKARLYLEYPGSTILTGWFGGDLAGFVMVTANEHGFARFCRSPRVLSRTLLYLLTGRYGWRWGKLADYLRWARQRLQPASAGDLAEDPGTRFRAWIGSVQTVPSYRGRGVASALMLAAEEYLRNTDANAVALYVARENVPARRLYEKLGYVEVAEVPRLGETCLLVAKNLETPPNAQ